MKNQRILNLLSIFIGLMCLLTNNAKGQTMTDRIYKKDKTVLFVLFLREQDDSIHYQNFEDKRKVIHSLLKTDVDKVVFKNGQTISFEPVFQNLGII